ncbi:MAG: toxin-antitoxin system HicB family antitoxin [Proteobacteria bacterium]|nr:toxin-antitoxin system HicB family antitoxin [Pseudomonadota bacterium]
MSDINFDDYAFEIRPLSEVEGGGYLISFPDLPGCISDGESPEEAMKHGKDAVQCWVAAAKESGDSIPQPYQAYSGKFVQRLPRSLHARLVERAKKEQVSLNALVTTYIAERLGH